MATLPSSLALETVDDGSDIVAAEHRNNYTALQQRINDLLTILAGGTSGQLFQSGGGVTVQWATVPENFAIVRDEKTAGTAGGSSSAATWNTRTLNTVSSDVDDILTLASNRVTLDAGTYRVSGYAPAYRAQRNKLRLRNVTDGTTVLVGTAAYSADLADSVASLAAIDGVFTVAASKELELQHYTEIAHASQGLGIAVSGSEIEVYSVLKFWKLP